ncbi:hypothetical protein VPH35_074039 [Triticum aestivum]
MQFPRPYLTSYCRSFMNLLNCKPITTNNHPLRHYYPLLKWQLISGNHTCSSLQQCYVIQSALFSFAGYRRCEIHNASFSKVIQIWPKELMRIFYKLLSVFHPSEMTEFVYTQDTYQTDLQKLEPYLTRKSLIVMILVVCVRKIVASVLSPILMMG